MVKSVTLNCGHQFSFALHFKSVFEHIGIHPELFCCQAFLFWLAYFFKQEIKDIRITDVSLLLFLSYRFRFGKNCKDLYTCNRL